MQVGLLFPKVGLLRLNPKLGANCGFVPLEASNPRFEKELEVTATIPGLISESLNGLANEFPTMILTGGIPYKSGELRSNLLEV
jgi:hypothetical protein